MSNLKLDVSTFTNGFGDWRAKVSFSHTLSDSDPREEFNLGAQWARIRRVARNAIVREIAGRERKPGESLKDAQSRVRGTFPNLDVIDQHVNVSGTWYGVTFGELYGHSVSDWN